MKSIKMFGKSVPLLAIVVISLLTIGASAVLLDYYGLITATPTVEQSVLVDGGASAVDDFVITAGGTQCEPHNLKNRADVPANIELVTTSAPVDGITVKYINPVLYSYSTNIDIEGSDSDLELTVSDDGDWVTWTFDFPVEEFTGEGNLNVGLIIATDGEGEGPAFQIHNNDGATGAYPVGTWLMSPWGPTIGDGWFGWHSGDTNTLVTDLGWVEASGLRNTPWTGVEGGDGVMTISINKAELGDECALAFHWAASPTVGSGFFAPVYDDVMQLPPDFGWATPLVDMGDPPNYIEAELAEDITGVPVTLGPGELYDFKICYEFAVRLVSGSYELTTGVKALD